MRGIDGIRGLRGLGRRRRDGGSYTPTTETALLLGSDTDWRQQDLLGLDALFNALRSYAPASGGMILAPLAGPDLARSRRAILYTNQVPALLTMSLSGVVAGDYDEVGGFTGDGSSFYDTDRSPTALGMTGTEAVMGTRLTTDPTAGDAIAGTGSFTDVYAAHYGSAGSPYQTYGRLFSGSAVTSAGNHPNVRWQAIGREATTHVRLQSDSTFDYIANAVNTIGTTTLAIGARKGGPGATTRTIVGQVFGKVAGTEANMTALKTAFDAWAAARAA